MMGRSFGFAVAAAIGLGMGAPVQASGWTSEVMTLIAAQHSYPRSAQIRGDQGTARIRLSVDAAGAITAVDLVQPTGSQILDREAVRIPRKIGTVPPPPGGPTKILIPIVWKLN